MVSDVVHQMARQRLCAGGGLACCHQRLRRAEGKHEGETTLREISRLRGQSGPLYVDEKLYKWI